MRDLLIAQEADQSRPGQLRWSDWEAQGRARRQGHENLGDRGVKAQRRKLEHAALGAHVEGPRLRRARLHTPRCSISTPLGLPVNPDV